MKSTRAFQLFIAIGVVVIVASVVGLPIIIDRYQHPRFHRVELGMPSTEVDAIIGAGHDDYPNSKGGWISYYFASEGTIVVVFDSTGRVIDKKLRD